MSQSIILGGVSYPVPTSGDSDWGAIDFAWNQALATNINTLQTSGLSVANIGGVPNSKGMTLTGTTLNLQPANQYYGGIITTGSQFIRGAKSWIDNAEFGGTVIIDALSGDHLTVNAVSLVVKETTGRVGIGTATPSYELDVTGRINLTLALFANGNAGTAGQVLKSSGSSAVPTWSSVTEAWVAPTLLNEWVNFGSTWATAGYYKDAVTGRVYGRGVVKSGTTTATTAFYVLPSGYRPVSDLALVVYSTTGLSVLKIVAATGAVQAYVGNHATMQCLDFSFATH